MQIGLGLLGWSPEEFWSATLREFINAKRGWQTGQGHPPVLDGHKLAPHEIQELQEFVRMMKDKE